MDGIINPSCKVGGDINYNFDTSKYGLRVYEDYKLDTSTRIRTRVDNFDTLSLGLTHNYRGLINFGFVTRVNISFELIIF